MSKSAFDELFVEFGAFLREAGLGVGTDDVITFCQGTAELDPTDVMDIYWSGRTTLVRLKDQIPTYNAKFREFFLDIKDDEPDQRKVKIKSSSSTAATIEIPSVEPGAPGNGEEETKMGHMASASDTWKNKAFVQCTPTELNTLRKLISTLRVSPPVRQTRRIKPKLRGSKMHMRKMVRETLRTFGDPNTLFFTQRKIKLRPIVFILDVSGSMADYSRNLLQFAYSARRANAKVEVFCFGSRLTRITKSLSKRTPDEAMELAGNEVLDWDGGTRIGDSLKSYVRDWGRTRIGRGAIVIICSDGLDRGYPEVLAKAMEDLSRLSYRILWMNPHKGDAKNFEPNTLGMIVADPFIDEVFSGHNLKSLEAFSHRLVSLR